MHRSQVFRTAVIAFLGGVFVASFLTITEQVALYTILAGAIILLVSAYRGTFGDTPSGIQRRQIGFVVGLAVIVFALGAQRFTAVNSLDSRLTSFIDRKAKEQLIPVTLQGYVAGDMVVRNGTAQVPFRVRRLIADRRLIDVSETVLVRTEPWPRYGYGDVLTLQGAPETPTNFSDFDYVSYLRKDGIRAIVRSPQVITAPAPLSLPWWERGWLAIARRAFRVREVLVGAINRALPEPNASFVNGILLGLRQNIPADLQQDFARTSTSHVLAISGYNVALVINLLIAVALLVVSRRRVWWLILPCVALFALITGLSASVMRAAVMALVVLSAQVNGRLARGWNALLLAVVLMVAWNPLIARIDLGFQLSVVAVAGLIAFAEPLATVLMRWRVPSVIAELVGATLAAQLSVAPLIAYTFGTVSLLGTLANLLIVPIIPIAMLFGFLTGVAGIINPTLGLVFGLPAWVVTAVQIQLVQWCSGLPGAATTVSVSWPIVLALYVGLVALAIYVQRRAKTQSAHLA